MTKLKIGMGFHTAAACYCDGIGDYLKGLADGGHTIAAKSVDSTSSLMDFQKLHQQGVQGYGVYRCLKETDVPNYGADIKIEAQRYLEKINEYWPPELDKKIFYVEMINECDKNQADWLGRLMVEIGTLFMANGYRVCGPSWSPGEPEPEHNRTEGMLAWFRSCAEYRGMLAHSVHEYAFDNTMESQRPWLMGRVDDVNAACRENGIVPPDILITEFGWSYRTAPDQSVGVPQILGQLDWYLANTPNVKAVFLWALDKSSQWANISSTINTYMEPLVKNIDARTWQSPGESVQPVVIPGRRAATLVLPETGIVDKTKIKFVEYLCPQEVEKEDYLWICKEAWNDYKRSIGSSVDHAIAALTSPRASSESYVVVWDSYQESQLSALEKLKAAGIKTIERLVEKVDGGSGIKLLYRPCDTKRVTQNFGARPSYYRKYGLPGHEGTDFGVGLGQPYYAVQDGIVVHAGNQRPSGGDSNYGWHCYIEHDGYHSLYAHGKTPMPVKVGQHVVAGQIVGYSGNSGKSSGPHLHFGLLLPTDTGNGYPMWAYGQCVDPLPYLEGLSPPESSQPAPHQTIAHPAAHSLDLLPYLQGDGRLYEVEHAGGGQERFQTQKHGPKEFWQTKNGLAEQLMVDQHWIYRGWDTSPGGGRYYQQQEPKGGVKARWMPRRMSVGETFQVGLWVQFYLWNGTPSAANSGNVSDIRRLVQHHDSWTSQAGITLPDVIEIEWVNGGELYFYAHGYGLVGWSRRNPDPNTPAWSSISEIHEAGARPENKVDLPGQLR